MFACGKLFLSTTFPLLLYCTEIIPFFFLFFFKEEKEVVVVVIVISLLDEVS